MIFTCSDERRRARIEGRAGANGIDFLEVRDDPADPPEARQRTLFVHFINPPAGLVLGPPNVRIEGGERVRDLRALEAEVRAEPLSGSIQDVLVVRVDRPGDFSTYTLRLVPDPANPGALDQLDPVLRSVAFSFKVNCPTDFDCDDQLMPPPRPRTEPPLDYLARDYASLRQMMLDRMAATAPGWRERNPADLGVALVELLAYVGDRLSYRQDAVATEAYLATCRLRTSARRHARLVDYLMHDGCNARTWVQVRVNDLGADPVVLPVRTRLYTAVPGLDPVIAPGAHDDRRAVGLGALVFQTMHEARLFATLNELRFHTWGARECCLPRGATRATLRGRLGNLAPGMVLVFVEGRSPRSGDRDDADFAHRHAVRLTEVRFTSDPLGQLFDDPPVDAPLDVTEIAWDEADALPFPLCLSSEADERFGGAFVPDVSIALGNIVLADHGEPVVGERLGPVPAETLAAIREPGQVLPARVGEDEDADDALGRVRAIPIPARFRPALQRGPLTQSAPYDPARPPPSASATINYAPHEALPAIELRRPAAPEELWQPRRDLLNSGPTDQGFVAEVEADGRATLRFGDDRHGSRPEAGWVFAADYRVGSGPTGNIGAGAIAHIVSADPRVEAAHNPLPGRGGVAPETVEEVRQRAPFAFRPQERPGEPGRFRGESLARAVTPDDYAAVAATHHGVQRAAARLRWTGSWRTVFLSVDRRGGGPIDPDFEGALRTFLEPYRLAGYDLEVDRPQAVPLEIVLLVRVRPGYFRADVRRAVLRAFAAILPDGRPGLFHPDSFSFGQTVYLSPIYAAAQAVDGVESVEVQTFQRRDAPGRAGLEAGKLEFGRLEIARLDNDPNFPDRGTLDVRVTGGK